MSESMNNDNQLYFYSFSFLSLKESGFFCLFVFTSTPDMTFLRLESALIPLPFSFVLIFCPHSSCWTFSASCPKDGEDPI